MEAAISDAYSWLTHHQAVSAKREADVLLPARDRWHRRRLQQIVFFTRLS
jgi:hypothetical protein